MKIHNLKKHQEDWFKENQPLGKRLGYPDCCIKAFCDQPPILLNNSKRTKDDVRRYKAGCIDGVFSGFIPCAAHAKQITEGKITLHSLIEKRDQDLPRFPHAFQKDRLV